MENNTEEKVRFFAQYYGQRVSLSLNEDQSYGMYSIVDWDLLQQVSRGYNEVLSLFSLESITEEHAIEVASLLGYVNVSKAYGVENGLWVEFSFDKKRFTNWADLWANAVDYIRKNGYAYEYDGKPVSELISLGWVKIKQQQDGYTQ